MRIPRAVLAALVPVVLLAACAGDDDALTDEEQEYADAFARDLTASEGGLGADAAGGRCIGTAIMRELGAAPFRDAGVAPDDLGGDESPGALLGAGRVTRAQATAIARAWNDCVDLPGTFAERAADQFRLDPEGVACLARGLRADRVLDDYLELSFTSADPAEAGEVLDRVTVLVQSCSVSADGTGGLVVESIAASLAADGDLDDAQARCVAQAVVDALGAERLASIGGTGELSEAPVELQRAFAAAILDAARACDVDVDSFGS